MSRASVPHDSQSVEMPSSAGDGAQRVGQQNLREPARRAVVLDQQRQTDTAASNNTAITRNSRNRSAAFQVNQAMAKIRCIDSNCSDTMRRSNGSISESVNLRQNYFLLSQQRRQFLIRLRQIHRLRFRRAARFGRRWRRFGRLASAPPVFSRPLLARDWRGGSCWRRLLQPAAASVFPELFPSPVLLPRRRADIRPRARRIARRWFPAPRAPCCTTSRK